MKIATPAIIGLAAALALFLVAITIIGSVDVAPAPPPAPLPVEPDLLTRHVNMTVNSHQPDVNSTEENENDYIFESRGTASA